MIYNAPVGSREFLEREIAAWKRSAKRAAMLDGVRYYQGFHDILNKRRTAIGKSGRLCEIKNLPNKCIVDNQYARVVDQKVNYLLGKPVTVNTTHIEYTQGINRLLGREFNKVLRRLGEDVFNAGIGWLHVYYDGQGRFRLRRFSPHEILPLWADEEHTELDAAVRIYEAERYGINGAAEIVERVEVYTSDAVGRFILDGGRLMDDADSPSAPAIVSGGKRYGWPAPPLIAFRRSADEKNLLSRVKTIQDTLNEMASGFADRLLEDARNTILILKNYDGVNLDEFRYNLAEYGAVKVKTIDGEGGSVEALSLQIDSSNYESIIAYLRRSLVENAMGVDARIERSLGTPSQINILSMYSDLDLDTNRMETEFQASLSTLARFFDAALQADGTGVFDGERIEFLFNRDMMLNESEIMDSLYKGGLKISNETLLGQVPWVSDVPMEMERLKQENKTERRGS